MALKDRLFETVALPILNRSVLAPYGHARDFRLDSRARSAEIVVDLKGEPEPLVVRVGRYDFSRVGDETFVTIHAIETSREWMTALAERNLVGKAIRVPREYASMVTKLA